MTFESTEYQNLPNQYGGTRSRLESSALDALADALACIDTSAQYDRNAASLVALIEAMPDGVTLVGPAPDFRLILNSAAAARILGRSAAELRGLRVGDDARGFGLRSADGTEPEREQSPLWRAIHWGERIENEEWVVQRPDGSRVLVCVNAVPLRDGDGEIVGAIKSWRDVTAHRRAESFARALNEISAKIHAVHDLSEIMAVAMREGTLATATESAAVSLFEHDEWRVAYEHGFPEKITGLRMSREEEPHAMLALERNCPIAIDDAYTDPRVIPAHMKRWGIRSVLAVPLVIGGDSLGVLFFNAHSHTLRFDAEDVEFASRLGTTLGLAIQNASTIAKLRDVDRKRMAFVALLSHELRNPLAPIKNCLYLLDRAPAGGQQAARAKATLNRQVDLLTRLVDDVLDVTRLTSGKLRLDRVRLDLAKVIVRIAEDHRASIEHAGLFFALELATSQVPVSGDADRIAQAVSNLLTNSAKFTPAGGRVTLRLQRIENSAVISVHDTGIGIEPTSISRLFEPFVQIESSVAQTQGGLGLGLALVKGVIELHGGTVEAVSPGLGRGAEFIIRLPTDEGAELTTRPRTNSDRPPARSILVIDDNVDAADTLRDLLAACGHAAESVYGGAEGIARAAEVRPELVLCDIDMPGTDGIAVVKAIRSRPDLRSMCLVAITGYALAADRRRAIEAGFDAFLRKPAKFSDILQLLDNLPQSTIP